MLDCIYFRRWYTVPTISMCSVSCCVRRHYPPSLHQRNVGHSFRCYSRSPAGKSYGSTSSLDHRGLCEFLRSLDRGPPSRNARILIDHSVRVISLNFFNLWSTSPAEIGGDSIHLITNAIYLNLCSLWSISRACKSDLFKSLQFVLVVSLWNMRRLYLFT